MSTAEVLHNSAIPPIPEPPASAPYQKDSHALVLRAENFTIATNDEFAMAGEILKEIVRKKSEIEKAFEPSTKAAFAAHRALTALVNTLTDPLKKADTVFRGKMMVYSNELKRQREEAERIEREAMEAMAREDQQRESDRLAQEAAELEKSGDTVAAQQVFAQAETVATAPVYVAPVVVTDNQPKVNGISNHRENWTIDEENVDLKALCQAVVDGKVPAIAVLPNLVFLRQQAKSMKSMFSIPGVRAYDKGGMTVRK